MELINGTASRIYEGFIREINLPNGSESSTASDEYSLVNEVVCCASWNTQNDFLHITAIPTPFRIYLDDILNNKQIKALEKLILITYVLENQNSNKERKRKRKNFELRFKDFTNFYREFQQRIHRQIAPHHPRGGLSKVLVLVNPFSGQQKALELWLQQAEPVFRHTRIPYALGTTSERGHATKIARELDLDQFSAMAIVSGDGLVAEVILGLLTRTDRQRALKLPILHIPGGTSNGLAASIAFQSNEPFPPRGTFCKQMALMITKPRYRPLRLYHVESMKNGKCVHQPMFMSMNWGLVADIDLASERFRWLVRQIGAKLDYRPFSIKKNKSNEPLFRAGMIRLHIEAFLRLIRLPSVARYKGRISYLPVKDPQLLRKTMLKANVDRKLFGENHFECDDVSTIPLDDLNKLEETKVSSVEEAFQGTHVLKSKVPSLTQPVPTDWEVVEGEFVFVSLTSMSHIGSDLPYLPCARLEEEIFYLTFVDWRTLKSRLHMAHLLITIDRCSHLDHSCFQTIPVLACRVEPALGAGGYVALDGEECESGAAFQVVSTSLQATVIGRQARE